MTASVKTGMHKAVHKAAAKHTENRDEVSNKEAGGRATEAATLLPVAVATVTYTQWQRCV